MPRALINVHSFLQDFNPSKFTVYFSLLIFSILFTLKLDNRIALSWWLIFLPLWIWKSIAVLGALVGTFIWLNNPDFRVSNSSYVHFKSMLISLSLQLLLLMFEILVCDKLETKRHTWTIAFTPLLFISLLSISVCVWSVKNGRGIELEFFAAINILQIVLIALKLDQFINWSWIIVFIPSWILLFFAIVVILYAMIFAAIVLRSPEMGSEQRRASVHSASSTSMIYLPLLIFIILLTSKLDSPPNVITPSYFITSLPLFITLLILIRLSFGSKSGSLWWFGMRADFCTFLLSVFPRLREYGNISFTMNSPNHRRGDTVADSNSFQDGSAVYNLYSSTTLPPLPSTAANLPRQQQQQELDQAANDMKPPSRLESGQSNNKAKRFLMTLSRVFTRADKFHEDHTHQDSTDGNSSGATKFNVDEPD